MKIISTIVLSMFIVSSASALEWVSSYGKSCAKACSDANKSPVISGVHKNGNALSICRSNENYEGNRAGFNLAPDSDKSCSVAFNGKEVLNSQYECLCN
ncbi:hypothetical protein GJV85_07155 [Sulfurimonas aquatica]|uniref:Cytochrome C n=1 Tax=Sulfurimonas aquatica TaxID=2672570 RepID=A0A975B0H8_9BACT|nr:hypothetical protein [Sulfurimonas aquatica]QSZ41890.1 hypothetical protein GJV85_07155 [Sulfurimonas aquatica]